MRVKRSQINALVMVRNEGKMNEFLEEMQELLKKHNACIVRSADGESLVFSLPKLHPTSEHHFDEIIFKEECSSADILYERYTVESK